MQDKNIAAIMIATQPTKREYVIGFTSLDLDGGLLNVVYDDSSFDQIPLSEKMAYSVDNTKIGPAVVSVQYQGFETAFTITIREPKLKRITIISPPAKTSYSVGEDIDLAGLRLMGHYDNEEEHEITEIPSITHKAKMGDAVVPISIDNLLIPILIRVSPAKVTEICLLTPPAKTVFADNEPFDLSGGSIKAKYGDGREAVIDLSQVECTGFDSAVPGKQAITLSYGGQSCTLEVENRLTTTEKFEITRFPNKQTYIEGEKCTIKGMELTALGAQKRIIPFGEIKMAEQYVKLGDTSITIQYQDNTFSIPITVQKKRLKSIAMETLPGKTQYKEGRDELEIAGASIKLCYNNGDTEIIPVIKDMVSGYTNAVPGEVTLTIEYNGLKTQCSVVIIPKKLTGITVSTLPDKTNYIVGEMFDTTGMVVMAFYDNGTSAPIERYMLSHNLPLSKEDTSIIITYLDMEAVISITVEEPQEETPVSEPVPTPVIPKIELPKAPVFYPPTFSLRFQEEAE